MCSCNNIFPISSDIKLRTLIILYDDSHNVFKVEAVNCEWFIVSKAYGRRRPICSHFCGEYVSYL